MSPPVTPRPSGRTDPAEAFRPRLSRNEGEEGAREAFQTVAVKEVLAFQIEEAMKAQKLSRRRLAERMGTSRSQIGRLLDPKDGNVTLATLQRAAEMLGRKARLGLVLRDERPEGVRGGHGSLTSRGQRASPE